MKRVAAFIAALAVLIPAAAVHAESGEAPIQLAYARWHSPTPRAVEAHALVGLLNAARARQGLPPLAEDGALNRFAADKADDMAGHHYFGHTDPNGVTFETRLHSSGLRYRYAAENIAFDVDAQHANTAFTNSPGHYANMVDRNHRKIGVAVVEASDGELFFVEEFTD